MSEPDYPHCAECGANLWIGESGLVCPQGHGRIVVAVPHGGMLWHWRWFRKRWPGMRVKHADRPRARFAAVQGLLGWR